MNTKMASGFHIGDVQHYLLIYNDRFLSLKDRDYFNKPTTGISVQEGTECDERLCPKGDKKYTLIEVIYRIENYFGDRSGRHIRTKHYYFDGENYYYNGEIVKRLPKQVKMAHEEFLQSLT